MRQTVQIFILCVALAAPARANELFCNFAAIVGSPAETQKLTERTYDQLWDALEGKGVSRETLDALIESGDPFSITERGEEDLGSLRTNLMRLRDMLTTKRWDTPEMRAALLDRLKARRTARETAAEKTEKAVGQNRVIKLPVGGPSHFSPGPVAGTLVASSDYGGPVTLLDLRTGSAKPLGEAPDRANEGRFSGDGKHFLYANDYAQLVSVPVANGQIQWGQDQPIGQKVPKKTGQTPKSTRNLTPVHDGNREWIYTSTLHEGSQPVYRFDVANGTRTALDYSEPGIKFTQKFEWGSIGGTTDFFIGDQLPKWQILLHRFGVDADGKVHSKGEPVKVKGDRNSETILWPNEDGPVIAHTQWLIQLIPTQGKNKDQPREVRLGKRGTFIHSVAANPKLDYFVAVIDTDNGYAVVALDCKTGKKRGEFQIPKSTGTTARLISDGTVALTGIEVPETQTPSVHAIDIGSQLAQ